MSTLSAANTLTSTNSPAICVIGSNGVTVEGERVLSQFDETSLLFIYEKQTTSLHYSLESQGIVFIFHKKSNKQITDTESFGENHNVFKSG